MKKPPAQNCCQGPFGWACLALTIALLANGLGFYALAWARRHSVPSPLTDHPTHPVFHAVITPNPDKRTTPDLPAPDTKANQVSPESKVYAPASIEPIVTRLAPLPVRLNTLSGDPAGLPVRIPDISQLRTSPAVLASGPQDPFSLGSVDELPRKVSGPDLRYPLWAQRKGLQATVIIRFLISSTGSVSHVKIHKVEGDESLAQYAQEAVSRWRFSPAHKQGKPVACWSSQEITFKLKDR